FVFRQAGRGRGGLGLLRIDGRRVARRPLAASGWRALLARFLALFLVLAGLLLRRLFLALAQQQAGENKEQRQEASQQSPPSGSSQRPPRDAATVDAQKAQAAAPSTSLPEDEG
ncbi:hypothetical protein ACV354_33040, partial [Pseudomonas aeruginosa]